MKKMDEFESYHAAIQKVAMIDNTVVNHTKLKAAVDGLRECIAWSEFNKEPAGAVLVGEGGTGKTTICNTILRLYAPYIESSKAAEIKVTTAFYAAVPSPSTVKTLAGELLRKLGDPNPRYGTADALTERLIKLLQTSQTKIILLDEFQHLLADSKVGGARANKICDWIKTLINETGVTICLVGTPDCEALVTSEPQLAGRFARRFHLYPLSLGSRETPGDLENFLISMGRNFISRLGFLTVPDFINHENSVRMWAATGGNLRFVMRLLKEAAVITLSAGRKDLAISDLAEAYEKGVTLSAAKTYCNPFVVSYESLLGEIGSIKVGAR